MKMKAVGIATKALMAAALVFGGVSALASVAGADGNGPNSGGQPDSSSLSPRVVPHSGGDPLSSAAFVPTSDTTLDVAGPVNSLTSPPGAATTLTHTGAETAGSAISPDGTNGLVGTDNGQLWPVSNPLGSPAIGPPLNVSQFTGEGGSGFHVFTDGVAIAPDGTTGLATADSQGAMALTHSSGSWAVDTSVQSSGLNEAGHPHQPGWIRAPSIPAGATTYEGVVISQTKDAGGNYVGLLIDAGHHTVAVVTGLGTSAAKVTGTATDATNIGLPGYNGFAAFGNGGMAFSPTSASRAVVVTKNGFEVLNLSNPADPTFGSLTPIAAASSQHGSQSIAVAPDGNHVAVAVNDQVYFFSGLVTSTPSNPLTQSTSPLTLAGAVHSLAYTASGNLVVNYANAAAGELAVISGSMGSTPALGTAFALSGLAPNVNGMSVLPMVAAINRGYWTVASDGGIFSFGDASFHGSMGGTPLNKPIVGMAATSDAAGYWEVASDGGIFSFGDATFHGSMGGKPLNKPIVGMAATPDGQGYWMVASDGGIFSFGDATFFGSMGGVPLNKPVVGMSATADGQGYWLVASDGGIFSFGDATFHGSMGGKPLNQPVVGMAATPDGQGYWEVATDGGIFAFGDAAFFGSMGGIPLNKPVVGIASVRNGQGYWMVASDGGIFSFGNAAFFGSMGGKVLNQPMVGMAAS